MRGTIREFEPWSSTPEYPNPDKFGNTKYWVNVDFGRLAPEETAGWPANAFKQDGSIRGSLTCKTFRLEAGKSIDLNVEVARTGKYLRFTRPKQGEGVPMDRQPQQQPLQGVARSAPETALGAHRMEMDVWLGYGFIAASEGLRWAKEHAPERDPLPFAQATMATALIQLAREYGVKVSAPAGYTAPAVEGEEDGSIPF